MVHPIPTSLSFNGMIFTLGPIGCLYSDLLYSHRKSTSLIDPKVSMCMHKLTDIYRMRSLSMMLLREEMYLQ